jgi:uncharacterized RDD family membrane protein YckC
MSSKRRSAGHRTRKRASKPRSLPSRRPSDASAEAIDLEFAGVGQRIFGYLIDLVLLGALNFTIAQVATHWFGTSQPVLIPLIVVHLAVVVSYGAVLISRRGATVGMSAAKLVAVDSVSCRFLEPRRAWARSIAAFALTGLALDVVYVWGLKTSASGIDRMITTGALLVTVAGYATYFYWAKWDALHQTLQDKVAHSIVLYAGAREPKYAGAREPKRRPKWSWRVAASGLSRQYGSGYTTPVGRKGR